MKKLTRLQCERKILNLMDEIYKTYQQYNPDADYLSMTMYGNGYRTANNSYFSNGEPTLSFTRLNGSSKLEHLDDRRRGGRV